MRTALSTLNSSGWQVDKTISHTDVIFTKRGPSGNKIFKLMVSYHGNALNYSSIFLSRLVLHSATCTVRTRPRAFPSVVKALSIVKYVHTYTVVLTWQAGVDANAEDMFNEVLRNFENIPTWNNAIIESKLVQVKFRKTSRIIIIELLLMIIFNQ